MTQEQSVVPPQDGGNYTNRDGLEHPHRLPVPIATTHTEVP
jgi:hypothetical protein